MFVFWFILVKFLLFFFIRSWKFVIYVFFFLGYYNINYIKREKIVDKNLKRV